MKVFVVVLGLIIATLLSGVAATQVMIRAYSATGKLDINNNVLAQRDAFTLGTRVLLTCDVTGPPQGDRVLSYKWYHGCTGRPNSRCEVRDRDPYYRVVNDTLLVDVTSLDHGGRYYCFVQEPKAAPMNTFTPIITVAGTSTYVGNPVPFLYTSTSLLPEHSVLTDVQQATGRNGQQWITCRSGGQRARPQIWMGSVEVVTSNSTANSATIGLDIHRSNGLYYCLLEQNQKLYFSLFLRNSVTLPTPTVSARDNSMWTFTSPDGSRVERYIVEFECSVQNITFVEKYMSVSASGGTGRVATSVSCFGGLGQLYRVKVWAVSGPNISRALVYIRDGQCRKEGGRETPTTLPTTSARSDQSPSMPSAPQGASTDSATMQPDGTCTCISPMVVPISIGTAMFLLGIATFTAGVVMLVRVKCKRTLNNSLNIPHPGTDHYEVVDGEKRAPPGPVVYEEVDKQDTQTDGHTKHYQELDLTKMERREYASIKV